MDGFPLPPRTFEVLRTRRSAHRARLAGAAPHASRFKTKVKNGHSFPSTHLLPFEFTCDRRRILFCLTRLVQPSRPSWIFAPFALGLFEPASASESCRKLFQRHPRLLDQPLESSRLDWPMHGDHHRALLAPHDEVRTCLPLFRETQSQRGTSRLNAVHITRHLTSCRHQLGITDEMLQTSKPR